jgi:threonine dehydrogenase-like Zn-dependent dehydrogenase
VDDIHCSGMARSRSPAGGDVDRLEAYKLGFGLGKLAVQIGNLALQVEIQLSEISARLGIGSRIGERVIAVDIAPERRKLARQFGAAEVIDPTAHDMVAAIRELTHGEGAHKTLDASSAPDARAAAVRSVRAWGTACFVGERGQVTLDVSADLLRRQVTLVGSWTFSKQGQAECAEFIAERKVDVERLFTHRWRLEQAEEAYRLFDTQTTGKAVILPS